MDYKKISIIFFVAYFFAGLFLYRDFGLHFDDKAQRYIGLINWNFIFNHDRTLRESFERYHGPAMEIVLVGVEKTFNLTDTRDIFLAHRLVDFLVFYFAVIAFFFTTRMLLGHDKWALLASVVLVLSPRIFADSFYNSKDITFLSFLIFSLFLLLKYIARPGFIRLLLLCFATAFAIDIRVLGIIILPVTLAVILREIIENQEKSKRRWFLLALYPVLLAGLVILFWPIMWVNPLSYFWEAIQQMKQFPWYGDDLYMGSFVSASNLPWHYIPVWILITTPVFYSLFYVTGVIIILKDFILSPVSFLRNKLLWGSILFLSVAPIVMVILLKSVLYDGWRHLFFIYPFFILISVYGFKSFAGNLSVLSSKIIGATTVTYLTMLAAICIYLHPYENVYFNFPALACFKPVNKQFEMDYWGLSFRQGLEYLIKLNPTAKTIKIYAPELPCIWNSEILKIDERQRLDYKKTAAEATYYITGHRFERKSPYGDEKIIYEIKKFDSPIFTIYKL